MRALNYQCKYRLHLKNEPVLIILKRTGFNSLSIACLQADE